MDLAQFIRENFRDRVDITTLYHYCRPSTLQYFIGKNEIIRCTRIDELNDPLENKIAIRSVGKYFKLKCGWSEGKFERLQNFFEDVLVSAKPFLPGIICFSRTRNNDALWKENGYIDSSEGGYCIGFKLKQLVRFALKFSAINAGIAEALIVPVFYSGVDDDSIAKIFDFYVLPDVAAFEDVVGARNPSWMDHLRIVGKMLLLSLLIKDGESCKCWENEKETRLVVIPRNANPKFLQAKKVGGKMRYGLIDIRKGLPIKPVIELIRSIDVSSFPMNKSNELLTCATRMVIDFYPKKKKEVTISIAPIK